MLAGLAFIMVVMFPLSDQSLQSRWLPLQRLYAAAYPSKPTDFWAVVATACTIGLLVVGKRGLDSLRVAKADIRYRSEREAKHCAITRCEEMATSLIPQGNELRGRLAAAKLTLFVKQPSDVDFESSDSELVEKAREWIARVPSDLHSDAIQFLNKLEAWSMYFVTGVADHKVAFGPCGVVFCMAVVTHLPYLLYSRSKNNHGSGHFPNIVTLFTDWTQLLENERNSAQISELIDKARSLQEKAGKTVSRLPSTPLGTDDLDGEADD